MDVKKLSGTCFALAILSIIILMLDVEIPSIPRRYFAYVAFGCGLTAIILNLLNVRESPHNPVYSIVYWVANFVVIIGLAFRFMHWPFGNILLFSGLGLVAFSFFLPKKRSDEQNQDDDVIDRF